MGNTLKFYMKTLLEKGGGAWLVFEFVANTEADKQKTRDVLLGADWHDAELSDWEDFLSARDAVSSILRNEEWVKAEGLGEAQKRMMRAIANGEDPCAAKNAE